MRTAVEDGAVVERSLRRKRVNQLGVHDEVAAKHQDGARVVGGAAVVGRREQRDELSLRKALESWEKNVSEHARASSSSGSAPSMTHSCARMIICSPLASQNSLTRSGPNVTRPGPRALGRSPMTLSFSVGSLRNVAGSADS